MIPEFRVWVHKPHTKRKIKKWMFYVGFFTKRNDTTEILFHGNGWSLDCSGIKKYDIEKCPLCEDCGNVTHSRDKNSVLMKYSYVNDIDGKGIFEGDIIGIFYSHINDQKLEYEQYDLAEVVFEEGCFGVVSESGSFTSLRDLYKFKVIGNKYENSELIENNNVSN